MPEIYSWLKRSGKHRENAYQIWLCLTKDLHDFEEIPDEDTLELDTLESASVILVPACAKIAATEWVLNNKNTVFICTFPTTALFQTHDKM